MGPVRVEGLRLSCGGGPHQWLREVWSEQPELFPWDPRGAWFARTGLEASHLASTEVAAGPVELELGAIGEFDWKFR
ncbi:MAG: hypothetical protein CMN30_07405 [Sandaracinus sp.]|nr:hypothetical protein [Sandaracinus sp.]